jgi:hypothetical protein
MNQQRRMDLFLTLVFQPMALGHNNGTNYTMRANGKPERKTRIDEMNEMNGMRDDIQT